MARGYRALSARRWRLREVPAEHAIDDRLGLQRAQGQRQHARRQRRDEPLQAQRAAEGARVARAERRVALERLIAGLLAGVDGADLAAGGDAEVKGRADPLAAEREAVARAVAAEEHPVLGGGAQAVREPVALPALHIGAEPLRQVLG